MLVLKETKHFSYICEKVKRNLGGIMYLDLHSFNQKLRFEEFEFKHKYNINRTF